MAEPRRPISVSTSGMVEPSPKPQIRRSLAVGISLRCLATNPLPGTKISVEQ